MIRYIIGIDYGHGETSAALVDLQAAGTPVEDLVITGNEKKIHSMMATFADYEATEIENIDPNDWVLSPDWSTLRYALTPEKMSRSIPPFAAYFKGPVSTGRDGKSREIDEVTKRMFGIFCKKVYDEIIENNRFLIPAVYDPSGNVVVESNFVLYVACPSGWEDNEQLGLRQITAYKEFLIENGIPCQDIVQESRAAYVTARDTVLRGLTYQETPGVLIVDFGSSTIDLTWFGNKPAFTDGYELGARNVEEILFDYLLNNEEPAKVAYHNYTNYVHPLVAKMVSKYGIRKLKEDFFDLLAKTNIPDGAKRFAALSLGEVTPGEDIDLNDPDFRFTSSRPLHKEEIMHILETYKVTNASLNNETYIGAVVEKLRSFAENPEVGSIDYVVLTGGATKMTFLQHLVKSVYNIADNHLIVDNIAPSFAISRGVATYGVKKYYSDPILERIEIQIANTWGNRNWLEPKIDKFISETVKRIYCEELSGVLKRWVDGNILADNNHNLRRKIDRIIEEEERVNGSLKSTDDPWGRVKYSTPIVDGLHSIHALLTSLMDLIEDKNIINSINEKVCSSITIQTFETGIEEESLTGLLKRYIEVYFPTVDNEELNFSIELPNNISVNFYEAAKLRLVKVLIEKCFVYVTSYGLGAANENTLNRDRSMYGGFASPGRHNLLPVMQKVIIDYAQTILSEYNLRECIIFCQEQIQSAIEVTKAKCELSTYTLQ